MFIWSCSVNFHPMECTLNIPYFEDVRSTALPFTIVFYEKKIAQKSRNSN